MIKFFRTIRQNLLSQNKVSKYLLYAIGEILLVVIGILIALNINNANEKRKNKEKITSILLEIQKDLKTDIASSIRVFNSYMVADSIQDMILNDKYTFEDYKEKRTQVLGFLYRDFVMQTNGYDNLMRNIDNVPKDYYALLEDLKHLYVEVKSNVDVYNTRIRQTVYKNIDFYHNLPWIQNSLKGIVTDEEIDFLLNDPKYKSIVTLYMNDRRNVYSQSKHYRIDAINLYLKIAEQLKQTDSIPEYVSYSSKDTTLLKEIVGHYELKERIGNYFPTNLDISFQNDKLKRVDENGDSTDLYWHKDAVFFIGEQAGIHIFNKNNKGELYITAAIHGNATYVKKE